MRKKISYILIFILIIGVGIWNPTIKVSAQTIPSTPLCWTPAGTASWVPNSTGVISGPTLCAAKNGKWSATQPTSSASSTTVPGKCLNRDGVPNGLQQVDCNPPNSWMPDAVTQPGSTPTTVDRNYYFLAPLPDGNGQEMNIFNPVQKNALGAYLNTMLKLFIGICAVLAVIMIVVGGIEYMTSELISNKEEGKKRITGAIFGLILALGAWTLLYQINPNLLISDVQLPDVTVKVTLDQANLSKTDQAVASVGTGYKLNGSSSSGVADFVKNHLKAGGSLSAIAVDTQARLAYFYTGSDWNTYVAVPISIGYNGYASAGTAVPGDNKTPIGTTTISSAQIASNGTAIVQNGYNFGAAFINMGIKDSAGNDRYIGFHGNATDTLGTTNGCVRMTNDDLAALAPYMKPGVRVIVK